MPLVPVIAITLPFSFRYPSSISEITGTPASFIFWINGESKGTPGLGTTRSNPGFPSVIFSETASSSEDGPTIIFNLSISSFFSILSKPARIFSTSAFSLLSRIATLAPSILSICAAPMPLRPVPITRTFFPSNSIAVSFSSSCFVQPVLHSRITRLSCLGYLLIRIFLSCLVQPVLLPHFPV